MEISTFFIISNYCYVELLKQISLSLLLYSHVPTAFIAILVGSYIYLRSKDSTSFQLFIVCILFALWALLDLGSWFTFFGHKVTMFTWSLLDLVGLLLFFFSFRFLYLFIKEKKPPIWVNSAILLLILPTIVTTIFGLNIPVYEANSCAALENSNVVLYPYVIQVVIIILVFLLTVVEYFRANNSVLKKKILFSGIGVFTFLTFFFSATFGVSLLLADSDLSLYVYNYEIYGLFGMPLFMFFLGYLIVKYKAFDIKLAGAQALVLVLTVLIGSQTLFSTTLAALTVSVITLLLILTFGYFLVKSVKREIALREQVEALVVDLNKANERLKVLDKMKSEFVSIASHQLRSPLTSIRGYASMLVEGTYGKFPEKAKEVLDKIVESSKFMALSIEDYLNVSRIEAGNMKYEMAEFNLKDVAEKVTDELRPVAMKKGLVMVFRSDCDGSCSVNADIGKTRQVIMNIVDNSMKYTPKGSITVVAHDDIEKKKMYISVQDTGVGLKKEAQGELFEKFVRAKNANSVNVTGTGLGLYVAKKMITDMKGNIWVESEGEGKGSTFHIELPLLPGNQRKNKPLQDK